MTKANLVHSEWEGSGSESRLTAWKTSQRRKCSTLLLTEIMGTFIGTSKSWNFQVVLDSHLPRRCGSDRQSWSIERLKASMGQKIKKRTRKVISVITVGERILECSKPHPKRWQKRGGDYPLRWDGRIGLMNNNDWRLEANLNPFWLFLFLAYLGICSASHRFRMNICSIHLNRSQGTIPRKGRSYVNRLSTLALNA